MLTNPKKLNAALIGIWRHALTKLNEDNLYLHIMIELPMSSTEKCFEGERRIKQETTWIVVIES